MLPGSEYWMKLQLPTLTIPIRTVIKDEELAELNPGKLKSNRRRSRIALETKAEELFKFSKPVPVLSKRLLCSLTRSLLI